MRASPGGGVAMSDLLPVPLARFSSVRFDGVADVAPAINAALVSLRDAGGGLLGLPASVDEGMLGETLVLLNGTGIIGSGHGATRLQAAAGVNADLISNFVSPDGILGNAEWIILRDFALDGARAENASGAGIFLTTNPLFTAATGDDYFDPNHRIENVRITRCAEDGLVCSGRSDTRLVDVVVAECNGYGLVPSFDTTLVGCVAGGCGDSGFLLAAASLRLVGCKSFYSGQLASGGAGFETTSGAGGLSMTACEAQDNRGPGFSIFSSHGSFTGIVADSNSTEGVGFFAGIEISASAAFNLIQGNCRERRANGSTSFQRNALRINGDTNTIRVTHAAEGAAVVDGAITADSTAVSDNDILINNEGGNQAGAFAASYTPQPYSGGTIRLTLTGNITINAVAAADCHVGTRMRFIFTQDATGGRTVTWNAAYKVNWTPTTTANKVNAIEFEYTGAVWVQVATAVNL